MSVYFKNVTLVSVGLIGGSLAAALKRQQLAGSITGVSGSATLAAGRELGLLDRGLPYDALAEGVADADLVVLCSPIAGIMSFLPEVMGAVKPGAVVTDVGSTKREIMRTAAACTAPHACFIGGHPMAGSEKSGITAADPLLFENAMYILTPQAGYPDDTVLPFRNMLDAIGARVIVLDADIHDRIAATISHLPQMLAVALVNTVAGLAAGDGTYLKLAAGGFRDMTRIASSRFSVWNDICATNPDLIRERIDAFIAQLEDLKTRVGADALADDFTRANTVRDGIPRDTKGFLYQHPEVMVITEDKPGMLARITGSLGDAGINISDIELLKVREGEKGTFRLSLPDMDQAARAVDVLTRAGFESRIRG